MAKSSILLCFVLFALVFASASATYIYGGYGYAAYPAYSYAVAYRPAVVGYAYPATYGYYGGLYGGYYLRK